MDDNAKTIGFVPPYIAFRTLADLIARMETEEPPARIDKSYLHNYSGGYQTQVLAALTSLGLIDATGTLQPVLLDLVAAAEPERKRLIGELIRRLYQPILALGTSATQQMMLDAFSELAPKVTGDTRRKAVAFFLTASTYAAVPVSRHWKTPRVPPSGKVRSKGSAGRSANEVEEEVDDDMRELTLRSGGVVTLGLSVDLFALSTDDRTFVFGLIDKMTAYENERVLSAGSTTPEAETS